jgi:hypothetical protein
MRIAGRAIHLGAFVPGSFVLPQTPVVLTAPTVRRGPNGVAEFVPGKFAVPQNPILDANRAGTRMAAGAGMGCGCNSGCGGGLGQTTAAAGTIDSVWTSLQSQTIGGFDAAYVIAGLLIAAPLLAYSLAKRK